MKNIEKYTNTKAALEEYNKLDFKKVPFDVWLELEYEEPSMQTLMEAAVSLTDSWLNGGTIADANKKILALADVIKREKAKPVRNCDKYKTVKEASIAFVKMCEGTECEKCCYNNSTRRAYGCRLAWIYSEAGKEA